MRKQTLQFRTLLELAAYARQLNSGYVINTQALTLTGRFSNAETEQAQKQYNAFVNEQKELLLDAC